MQVRVDLDWRRIRTLDGKQDKAFEELCAQLARVEIPIDARFVRKGVPDAGVECYAILSDGSEWGWQAKYFNTLGSSQWSQIDKSVKTAIEKHPRLVRYFICVPLDLPDARIDGRKSAREKWDEHVQKWKELAANRGMNVEFVYWGRHELIERLTRPEHIGRVRFWFNATGFDAEWFNARLEEALRTAGPRYTPEVHVDLPIALEFEAFGRTDRFFERQKTRARSIRKALRELGPPKDKADEVVKANLASLFESVEAVLSSIGNIERRPTGPLPFKALTEQISSAVQIAEELLQILDKHEREYKAKTEPAGEKTARLSYHRSPFRDLRFRLLRLLSELQEARESFEHADSVAGNSLMILRGNAGTGKTHLLCDIAQRRIAEGLPTLLLMGQRFISNDEPWVQALQQLDLADISAEEFVGALEAAAQAAGSRALVMIDALNEGTGRTIWPSHLAAFLAHLERSPWIGVVLSIRSSYEEIVIPEEVRRRAVIVTHSGFAEREYDATKTFFTYYGLELPSTPLLAPEFQKPLFLKTLCQGLRAKGERRLPRGFQGITAIFDLYLSAVNERLAPILDFDRRDPLVRQALEAVTEAIIELGKSWLPLAKAKKIVDAFLPGRGFEQSLYRGLVAEGVLVEETSLRQEPNEEIVFIAYERFADHLAAKILLDRHLDTRDPGAAFAQGGALTFICDEKTYVSPGLLEAICIQLPERTGKELPYVAPNCMERWELGDAFRQSLIWREYEAFSEDTQGVLNKLTRSEDDLFKTLDMLLTVATLPNHPLNARFLDRLLRRDTMPDRDAWWSVYLHHAWGKHDHAWGKHGAVDRLVDWASSVSPGTPIDEETVDLCATTLSWMLTTSNRFLRDRATKALVSFLTERLDATVRLVERFSDIDDPYVAERIYAVAYGVAMRCHDPVAVGPLAQVVYDRIFAAGSPPPHILMRDYARGVVERALFLGSRINVNPERIRPPYRSTWPKIPSEEDIKPLMPDRSKGSYGSGDPEWARNSIGFSVMHGDFARYIIGTNSSPTSSTWLSLTLEEPPWISPEEQLQTLVAEFSADERRAWEEFQAADTAYAVARSCIFDRSDPEALAQELENDHSSEIAELEKRREEALTVLEDALTEEHTQRLSGILAAQEADYEARQPQRLDLRQIQRYVLWRVFDLGWTTERFGHFDRFAIGHHGRDASKAERIGKKYQWIAYREIMAFVSDRFQYREQFHEEGAQTYQGPWQIGLRDIDPSCTIKSLPGGTSWDGHSPAWWGPAIYDAWGEPNNPRDWILQRDNLPKVEDLLVVTNPKDSLQWLNVQGYFKWKQPLPPDRESTEIERRELWYLLFGYLLRSKDAEVFLEWAKGVDFWGRWMPEAPEVYEMFLGEHGWAPAARYFQRLYYGDDGWVQPNHGCPVKIRNTTLKYISESGGFDCSVDEGFSLRLPSADLVAGLGIRWSGFGADFVDMEGRVIAQDPTVHSNGPTALLLRQRELQVYLDREGLTICWTVLGGKGVTPPNPIVGPRFPLLRISGAYALVKGKIMGFTQSVLYDPDNI